MTDYSVSDWQRESHRLEGRLSQELINANGRLKAHREGEQGLEEKRQAALADLSTALLPAITAPAIAQAVQWTGYAPLAKDDIVAEMQAMRTKLEQRNAEIEADPIFQRREERDPETGKQTLALREAQKEGGPFLRFVKKAKHPRLEALILGGYGTDSYDVPWWRMSYYSDWQAGDEILEAFPEKNYEDFAAFRSDFLKMNQVARRHQDKIYALQKEFGAGRRLEAEHHSNLQVLEDLEAHYLGNARVRIEEHLKKAGAGELKARLGGAPHLEALAKRWAGISKQLAYMQQLREQKLDVMQQRLNKDLAKVRHKRAKYRRPKKRWTRFTEDEWQRTFQDRTPKYQKHWNRYDQGFSFLRDFDRYDDGYLDDDDGLWWDLMTDGRQSGNYLPDVRSYRERNPEYRYRRKKRRRDDDEDAAARIAEAALDADDDFSFDDS